jgi:hypothetical protein
MGAPTPRGLSDEKAARMMVALREGTTLRNSMCHRQSSKLICDAQPEYARQALPLHAANMKAAEKRKHPFKTHCKHGHTLADARVYIRPGYVRRDCRHCWAIHLSFDHAGSNNLPEAISSLAPIALAFDPVAARFPVAMATEIMEPGLRAQVIETICALFSDG